MHEASSFAQPARLYATGGLVTYHDWQHALVGERVGLPDPWRPALVAYPVRNSGHTTILITVMR